jgi:4-amino-4-deoxy-L-arabinose transferase-like glycosyltransferase
MRSSSPDLDVSLAGLVLLFRTEQRRVLMALLFAFFGLIIVAIKAGDTFVRHDYYILPFVPFMAIAAAFALQKIPVRRWRIAALALCDARRTCQPSP